MRARSPWDAERQCASVGAEGLVCTPPGGRPHLFVPCALVLFCGLLGFWNLTKVILSRGPKAGERPTMSLTQQLREVLKALGSVRGFDRVLEKVLEAEPLLVRKGEKAPYAWISISLDSVLWRL